MFLSKLRSIFSSQQGKAAGSRKRSAVVLRERHIYLFFFTLCLLQFAVVGGLLALLGWLDIPDLGGVLHYRPAQATVIYDRSGNIVDRMFTENRTLVPLEKMPPWLPLAFVAAEDGSFFTHKGVDFFSILRALFNNIRHGGREQGGSTITQQVIKSLLLNSEKSYLRKIKEAILAWRIDRVLSKEEILHIYLNQIYLGAGAHGVEAAAQVYFDKSADALTLGESALLAGLPQAPSRYSLFSHQRQAATRQRYVLNRMVADGYISAEAARAAYEQPVHLNRHRRHTREANGYYLEEVKRRARMILGQSLQRAGVKIYTCLDPVLQSRAERVVKKGIAAFREKQQAYGPSSEISPQGALVAIESKNGRVRALVGGTSFIRTPYNRAVQARRPAGSTFKPLVYSAALQAGWQPGAIIDDTPLSIRGSSGRIWSPKNYGDKYMGQVSLTTALTHSLNTASIRLMQKVGYKAVHKVARDAGISGKLPADLSLALGAVDVSLLEMTGAYGIFANRGRFYPPRLIEKIVLPSGRVVYPADMEPMRVLPVTVADQMRAMLASVVANGTGRRVRDVPGIGGGKTGTSDESRDAWFIGYNNRYTAGVWVGCDRNQSMGTASGGSIAAPIWRQFMLGR